MPRPSRRGYKKPSMIDELRSSGGKSTGFGRPQPQQERMKPKRYRRGR